MSHTHTQTQKCVQTQNVCVQTQNVSQGFEADGQGAHLLQTSLVLHTKCLGNPCVNLGTGVTSFGLKLGSHQTSHQTWCDRLPQFSLSDTTSQNIIIKSLTKTPFTMCSTVGSSGSSGGGEEAACFICLNESLPGAAQFCKCPAMVAHRQCLARWWVRCEEQQTARASNAEQCSVLSCLSASMCPSLPSPRRSCSHGCIDAPALLLSRCKRGGERSRRNIMTLLCTETQRVLICSSFPFISSSRYLPLRTCRCLQCAGTPEETHCR